MGHVSVEIFFKLIVIKYYSDFAVFVLNTR
jgi:hypothetical protein